MKNASKTSIIQGGMGAEREVSLLSAQAVAKALKQLKIPYHIVECDQHIAEKLKRLKPERAFLAVHGQYAEDGTLQGLLEYLKIPYTGSDVLSSALCMDKCFFKDLIFQHKVPTPDYQNLNFGSKAKKFSVLFKKKPLDCIKPKEDNPQVITRPLPFVIKPARSGSTLGVSLCRKTKDIVPALKNALKYDYKILVEDYTKGPELAFSYLNGKILTPVEVVAEGGFYDYKSKYQSPKTQYILPPRIDQKIIKKAKKRALKAFKLTGVRTYGRADFIIQNNKEPLIIEINTLPGLTKKSLFPKSAEHDGISFNRLIKQIWQSASLDYPFYT